MTTLNRRALVSALVGLCVAMVPAASAHHSQSEYDQSAKVEVTGTVTKVEWRSPHAWIYVDVVDDQGQTVNWSFELPSPVTLMRRGWKRDSVKPGDVVSVSGARARHFPTIALGNAMTDSDGKPLFTGTTKVYEP